MRIGIFGGTFDPIHLGHLILAEEAYYQLGLNKLLWILTPEPPHKSSASILNWVERLNILAIAVSNNPNYEISKVDIQRQPPTYAVDTMHLIKKEFPNDTLIYLIGSDSLCDLPRWHRPIDLITVCDGFGVMKRSDFSIDYDKLEEHLPGINQKIYFLDTPMIDVSSTDIRSRIANGKPYRYFLIPEVYEYINTHRLYTSGTIKPL